MIDKVIIRIGGLYVANTYLIYSRPPVWLVWIWQAKQLNLNSDNFPLQSKFFVRVREALVNVV